MHGLNTMAHLNRQREAALALQNEQRFTTPASERLRTELLLSLGEAAVRNMRSSLVEADRLLEQVIEDGNGVVVHRSQLMEEARLLVQVYDAVAEGAV